MSVERVAELQGVGSFHPSKGHFRGGNVLGATDPFFIACIFTQVAERYVSASGEYLFDKGTNEWAIAAAGSSGGIRFARFDSTTVGSQTQPFPPGIQVSVLTVNAGEGRLYSPAGREATQAGLSPIADGTDIFIGRAQFASRDADDFVVHAGLVGRNQTLPTDAEVLDWIDTIRADIAQGRTLTFPWAGVNGIDEQWDAREIDWVNGTWDGSISATQLTRQNASATLERAAFPGRVL